MNSVSPKDQTPIETTGQHTSTDGPEDLSELDIADNLVDDVHFDYAKKPKKKKKKKKEHNYGTAHVDIHNPSEEYPEERVIYADKSGSVVVEHMKKPRARTLPTPAKKQALDQNAVRQFWFALAPSQKRVILRVEKGTILQSMRAAEKYNCNCAACGRKRDVVETELERIFNLYYPAFAVSDAHLETFFPFETSLTPPDMSDAACTDVRPQTLYDTPLSPSNDGIMTVADDLLKNNGEKFIGMMERLAETRMARDADPVASDEEYEEYDDDYCDEYEEDEYDERERIEQGLRMIQLYTDRMIYKRIVEAYRNHQADLEANALIDDLAREEKRREEAKEKKKKKEEEKKVKRKAEREAKEQERARKEQEIAEKARAKEEEGRRKTEEARQRREEAKRAKAEEDRLRIEKRLDEVRRKEEVRLQEEARKREEQWAAETEAKAAAAVEAETRRVAEVEARRVVEVEARRVAEVESRRAIEAQSARDEELRIKETVREGLGRADPFQDISAFSEQLPGNWQQLQQPQQFAGNSLWSSAPGTQPSPFPNTSYASNSSFTQNTGTSGFTQSAGYTTAAYPQGSTSFSTLPFPGYNYASGSELSSFSAYDLPNHSAGSENVSSKLGSLSLGARQRSSVASLGIFELNSLMAASGNLYNSNIWGLSFAQPPTLAQSSTLSQLQAFAQTPAFSQPQTFTQPPERFYREEDFAQAVRLEATQAFSAFGSGAVKATALYNAVTATQNPRVHGLDLNSFIKIMMGSDGFDINYDAEGCGVVTLAGNWSAQSTGVPTNAMYERGYNGTW
ncbi:hypothetical protein BABINDRAFT_162915 [Babjeviella inositovora NRRL Y-12698]|uniref:Stress response protein NST1 n=1 Tax=Babjeviella inositovora NRRL Y-12698 TaxID=984486 RepID=A0A1E3QKM7_9ASCO|nr:uncharacterized protein BABINDRAFT_162915 [Babjeviella inositovora NRRL Y-12698]ODQ78259.1 hypothetical protein BABINDRAFT_162915 [Babjeviella inositovora NRRL Y-12698]